MYICRYTYVHMARRDMWSEQCTLTSVHTHHTQCIVACQHAICEVEARLSRSEIAEINRCCCLACWSCFMWASGFVTRAGVPSLGVHARQHAEALC